jgi:hypothetical protein
VPQEAADIRVIITSPASATHDDSFSPIYFLDPEVTLFVAFCKTTEMRADLLERLREAAKAPGSLEEERETVERGLDEQYRDQWRAGETDEALVTAVRWWTQVKRQPYHAYSLKAGVGPYRTSCLVAFEEPDAMTMRFNLARALDVLERERTRVMDFFGWDGTTEGF